MNVELLSVTPDALNLLLRTKGTRLAHSDDPSTWSEEKKAEHLEYMRDTIKSSWEFVDYTFKISGVTRAFTHQLVRTRTGSYAQEAMRVIDARDHEVTKPDKFPNEAAEEWWDEAESLIFRAYGSMLDLGVAPQDARGILPTNITTSIVAKFNLRTLANTGELRLCTRTQGEYQNVFREMRRLAIEVHPWAEEFINVYCANHGTCAFPNYGRKECPYFKYTVHDAARSAGASVSHMFWAPDAVRHEASPIAKAGKAV